LSHVPNALRKDVLSAIKKRTRKSGRGKRGKKPVQYFSQKTRDVSYAEIRAKYHITRNSVCMVSRNISDCVTQRRTVPPVIEVNIEITFNAVDVARLEQNPKVNSAIDALLRRIRNELYFAGNTGSESEMHKKKNGDNGLKSG
jgi:hypothetical protein